MYIYCTKEQYLQIGKDRFGTFVYLCEKNEYMLSSLRANGKVVARFWCDNVEEILYLPTIEQAHEHNCYLCKLEEQEKEGYNKEDYSDYYVEPCDDNYLVQYSGLKGSELHNYLKGQKGYAIHISKLEIFDKPKELNEFYGYTDKKVEWYTGLPKVRVLSSLSRAPQSRQYIEVEE